MVEPALGTQAVLGRWVVRIAVLPVGGDFQRRRQDSATTAHRALLLPICEVASPGHAMGYCKDKCSLCSVKQQRRSLHWVLQ